MQIFAFDWFHESVRFALSEWFTQSMVDTEKFPKKPFS